MSDQDEPKIIVDDDWKEQVQREKEEVQEEPEPNPNAGQIPEASFSLLVTSLTTQALSALGFIPNPATGKAESDPIIAKHFVDTLAVLEEKTAGNLTDEEFQLLNESLHQLRMAFVAAAQAAQGEPHRVSLTRRRSNCPNSPSADRDGGAVFIFSKQA